MLNNELFWGKVHVMTSKGVGKCSLNLLVSFLVCIFGVYVIHDALSKKSQK